MENIVTIKLGKIKGIVNKDNIVYKGVPYAKAPVGDLRFCAPQKVEKYDGVIDARAFKAKAMQAEMQENSFYYKEFHDDNQPNDSEDCLHLNIYTPINYENKKYPVAFWIHGGAFDHGASSELEIDGAAYTKNNVILISINYRLGALGFLVHEELNVENEHGVSGNYGLLDQIMALEWVKENIENFGGDPNNITIFGQSAGCMSVQYLLSCKLAKGLFNKAILQSGGGYRTPFMNAQPTLEDKLACGVEFLEALGVNSITEARKKSAEDIIKAQNLLKEKNDPRIILFLPVIDKYVLETTCQEAIDEKLIENIPLIIGSNSNEMGINIISKGLVNASAMMAKKFDELHYAPVYAYYFDRQMPGDNALAFHSAELWFMFNTLKKCWRPFTKEDAVLSNKMVKYWTNFMKNGDPNGKFLVKWTPYIIAGEHMVFDIESKMSKVI